MFSSPDRRLQIADSQIRRFTDSQIISMRHKNEANIIPSVYSTHEHTTTTPNSPLPLDITLELLASILLLSTGIVLTSQPLKPIQWSRWSGKMSREGRHGTGRWTREGEEVLSEGDPYAFLGLDGGGEGRRGFFDVRGKRREYAEWVKGEPGSK
ncbi:hypothetical protein CC78DRAFT_259433 [Lojkania enalia]|uniref:Uncharacterized protein n=1 Tax=Lojkania enalia TaxID=147567 RepID=A0A9P4K8D6_9PLEO|nr:hypothetical protein CC78DRAFT_259433 [Didymosphaeria enalia]